MDKRILLIEDEEALLDFERVFFEMHGYTVYTATDGDAGLELARRHRPPIIVCDVIMGRMHGFEVLQGVRSDPALRETAVIVTSAKAYKPDIDRALALGATEYVVKPFQAEELLALVERHLPTGGER